MPTCGAPLRPVRADYGPEPENRFPVREPAKDFDGETMGRLMLHELAASAQVRALAVLLIAADGSLLYRWESWNVDRKTTGDFAPPVIDVSTPGDVVIEYDANLPDRLGDGQPVVFRGGSANVQSADKAYAQPAVLPTDPLTSTVTVRCQYFDSGAFVAGLDAPLLVALW